MIIKIFIKLNKYVKHFLNLQTKNINLATLILGIASFFSAALGLFRDRLLAKQFGISQELDIYYAAFKIPDFVSYVLIMGAISAAVIPIFSKHLSFSQKHAWIFLSNTINLFLIFLVIILFFLIIFTPQLITLIAPGFSNEQRQLTIALTRIMFLSPILLGISNIISSVLQVFKRFLVTSLAPIMYNIGIIIGILFFVPKIGIFGLGWGVVLGGLLHILIQIPILIKIGFRPVKILNIKDPNFLELLKLTIPRSIGLAASQINLIIITAIASTLGKGSIAVLNLAENLSRPLLILIGVSYATAAFPALSMAFSQKNKEEFDRTFSFVYNKILFLLLISSFLLFVFRDLVVKFILMIGKFSITDVDLTAACLGMFCLGIFAQGLNNLLVRTFHALRDTKTPTVRSIFGIIINICFCFLFIKLLSFNNFFQQFLINFFHLQNITKIEIIALPLSISLSAIIQFLFLLFFYYKWKNKN